MRVGWWLGLVSLWLVGAGCREETACAGTADPCATRNHFACIEGCVRTSACQVACSSLEHADECTRRPACSWSYADTSCQATSDPCSASTDEQACLSDLSCQWSPSCTGSPNSCGNYDEADTCSAIPGCMPLIGL